MLSFKKALVLSLACLTLFFLFKTTHSSAQPSLYKNANDMPKPASMQPKPKPQEVKKDKAEKAFDTPSVPKKQRAQIPLDELHRKPLRKQLEYQFPYDIDAKFPAYIWQTWKYTLPAFLVPLAFVTTDAGSHLVGQGSLFGVLWTTVVAAIAVAALAGASTGWILGPASWPERALLGVAALLLLYLAPVSIVIGLACAAAAVALHVERRNLSNAENSEEPV